MPVEIGWGQEDQEDDEVSEPSEETRTPVKMNDPHAPSQKEREQHEMTHLPFRSWCSKCVFGRGMPHWRNKDEKVMPEVHLDFMFLGPKDSPGDTVPCLVLREVVSNMVMAAVVLRKTTGLFAAKRALAFLSEVGCLHGDLIVSSDQGPSRARPTKMAGCEGQLVAAGSSWRRVQWDRVGPTEGWRGPYNPYRTRSVS